jgi:NAD(P)H-dependent FMN reductase
MPVPAGGDDEGLVLFTPELYAPIVCILGNCIDWLANSVVSMKLTVGA